MSELAIPDPTRVDVDYWTESIVFAARVAEKVADTEFVPAVLRGRPDAVAATILYGLEVGLTPMQALQGIHIVEGRPAPSAEMMRALIFRHGHTMVVHDASGTRVRISGLRHGRPESERVTVEWTIDMARAAGLLGRRNWQNYPRAMLMARASGDLARILFPDVIKGLGYVAEDDETDASWLPVEQTPTSRRPAIQRRRATSGERTTEDTGPLPTDAQTTVSDDHQSPVPVAPPLDRPERTDGGASSAPVLSPLSPSADDPDETPLPFPDELEPEPSAPEPVAEDAPAVVRMVAAGPLKAIQTGLSRHLGTAATREERLSLIGAIVGHDVESSKELTRAEGYRVIDYLTRFDDGSAAFTMDPETGECAVHDLRTPDDDGDE